MAKTQIDSRMAIAGHPIHPTLIHFPVAALLGLVATDAAYFFTEDFFWARAGFWLCTVGAFGGWLSGTVGLIDLVIVRSIRELITAWNHGVLAIMMLSLATFNWLLRWHDPAVHILPWGAYMSCITAATIVATSLLGGQLVYEHAIGVDVESEREA